MVTAVSVPSPGRWYDLRQGEAELEERNRVLHHQQQPDAALPTHAGFGPQGERVRQV